MGEHPTRIDWEDIVQAARQTSEDLAGSGWVKAGIKARVLLADLADEMERLRTAERDLGEALTGLLARIPAIQDEDGNQLVLRTDEPPFDPQMVAMARDAVAKATGLVGPADTETGG